MTGENLMKFTINFIIFGQIARQLEIGQQVKVTKTSSLTNSYTIT